MENTLTTVQPSPPAPTQTPQNEIPSQSSPTSVIPNAGISEVTNAPTNGTNVVPQVQPSPPAPTPKNKGKRTRKQTTPRKPRNPTPRRVVITLPSTPSNQSPLPSTTSTTELLTTSSSGPNSQWRLNPPLSSPKILLTPNEAFKRVRSGFWDYFKVIQEGGRNVSAVCQKPGCSSVLSLKGGGTTMLKLHLSSCNPQAYDDVMRRKALKRGVLPMHPHSDIKKKIDQALVKFLTVCFLPLSLVNETAFQQFCEALNPAYDLPERSSLRTTLLASEYERVTSELTQKLSSAKSIAITTDIWTSVAKLPFITLTAHYLNTEWDLEGDVLKTMPLPGQHTFVQISNAIADILEYFHISKHQVSVAVTDNGSNVVKTIENLRLPHIRCAAHTLQRAIHDGLKVPEVEQVLAGARAIVSYYHRSPLATHFLGDLVEQLGDDNLVLFNECATRWNSTYMMIERLLKMKQAVKIDLSVNRPLLCLSEYNWSLLSALCDSLAICKDVTDELQGQKYESISLVYPFFERLLLYLNTGDMTPGANSQGYLKEEVHRDYVYEEEASELSGEMNDLSQAGGRDIDEVIKEVKQSISEGLIKRYAITPFAMCATALDPRFKSLDFLPLAKQDRVWQVVRDQLSVLFPSSSNTPFPNMPSLPSSPIPPSIPISSLSTPISETSSLPHSINASTSVHPTSRKSRLYKSQNAPSPSADELKDFQNLEVKCEIDLKPNLWWKNQTTQFPLLSTLAQKVFSIPATSAPSERVFSVAGLVIRRHRARLEGHIADLLIFLHDHFLKTLKHKKKLSL